VAKIEKGNIFYSPFSIHVIMFMASTGAASKTFDEMVATLHLNETTHSLEAYGKLLEALTVSLLCHISCIYITFFEFKYKLFYYLLILQL